MKICNNCHRATLGDPIFCNYCGSSYDVKLCPRLHINPRAAKGCSQCGSREFSMPQPKVSLWKRPLLLLLTRLPGFILLTALVVFVGFFIHKLITDPNGLLGLMLLGLVLGLLLLGWMQLPSIFSSGNRKARGRKP